MVSVPYVGAIRGHTRWYLRGPWLFVGISAASGTKSGERLVLSDPKLVTAPLLTYDMCDSWPICGVYVGAIRGHKRLHFRGSMLFVGIPAVTGTKSGQRLVSSDQKLVAAPRLTYVMCDSWPIRGVYVGAVRGRNRWYLRDPGRFVRTTVAAGPNLDIMVVSEGAAFH